MKNLAVLVSNAGTGTNLQAIIDAIESKKLNAKILVVISDVPQAYSLIRATKYKLQTHIFDSKKESLHELLTKVYPVDYICLTGWKKIIQDSLIDVFPNKILNVHPGLIPESITGTVKNPDKTEALWNRGKFTDLAIQNFLDNHTTYAGSTVHFLSHEFDFGKVVEYCFEKVLPNDTVESLYKRLKIKENRAYVKALIQLCNV